MIYGISWSVYFFPCQMLDRIFITEHSYLKATLSQDIIQFLESGYFFHEMLEDIFQQNPAILKPLSYMTLNSPGCSEDRLPVWPNPFMPERISSLMTCPLSFWGLCANLLTYAIYMQLRMRFTNSWWAHDWNLIDSFCFNCDFDDSIRSQFCTCHNSWAVVACAKLWTDLIVIFLVRATLIFFFTNFFVINHLWNGFLDLWECWGWGVR